MTDNRPCNSVGALLPGQLESFRAELSGDLTMETTVQSDGLLCELLRPHADGHACCVGAASSGEDPCQEVWAIWPPEVFQGAPNLWMIPPCDREGNCIYFDNHPGACSPGISR